MKSKVAMITFIFFACPRRDAIVESASRSDRLPVRKLGLTCAIYSAESNLIHECYQRLISHYTINTMPSDQLLRRQKVINSVVIVLM